MLYRATLLLLLAAVILTAAGPAAAQLPNITYKYASNWAYPLLPTITVPGSSPLVLPPTLPGNTNTIYWNMIGHNNGTAPTPVGFGGLIIIDGVPVWTWGTSTSIVPVGGYYFGVDKGPLSVRGGRHTFEVVHDDQDLIVESDENDNVWAHQFVFTPYVLSPSTPVTRGTPPIIMGGTSSVVDGSAVDYNCDGFRFSTSGWWNVVTVYAKDSSDDYDMEIFYPSTGSENGFLGPTLGSYFVDGYLDGAIVNRNTVGIADYDISVVNAYGTSDFVIEQVTSEPAGLGANMTVSLGTDEYLRIWDTWIGATGWVTVAVTDSLARGEEVWVALLEHDVTETTISDITGWEYMGTNGEARLHRDITVTNYYGLVICRHPLDGGFPMDLTVSIEPTPPDLVPVTYPLWHSPLVPTPVPMTGGLTPTLPDTLHGFMPQTYLNLGLANESQAASPAVDVTVYQDGMDNFLMWYYTTPLGPLDVVEIRDIGNGVEYPGGRHVLTAAADYSESIHEIYEGNNIYGEQYCWSPLELSLGWEYSHNMPGPITGGFNTTLPGEPFFYNCDGYRFYNGYSEWEGMVLTQGPNSDYDLSVHFALEGVKNGFDDYLAESYQFQGETDYVLFNNNLLAAGVYDIGVENFLGTEPYTVEMVGSTNLPMPPLGHHGPYTMPISDMLHLYNIYLEADMYAFRLDNVSGSADWSFALHPYDQPLMGRPHMVGGAVSNRNGPGDPEWFTEVMPAPGYYCLAVCKATPFGFDVEGSYQLTILQGVSEVSEGSDLPAVTALAGVHPNPFNPQATISYDLAVAAVVELEIFDVKGALVRRLVSESMPAGRHAAVWNGKDDSGARVASGAYLARFNAGAYRDVRKLVMVK